jgi:hypothetical protein
MGEQLNLLQKVICHRISPIFTDLRQRELTFDT